MVHHTFSSIVIVISIQIFHGQFEFPDNADSRSEVLITLQYYGGYQSFENAVSRRTRRETRKLLNLHH